ncbi:hypothetical protein ACMX25_31530 [Caballeronia sp. 15715]|uniref:hypothetical protein n=1 Tax=Caballeronia sp. 15715 TaxID=3391030 RepID=UPI0039E3D65C
MCNENNVSSVNFIPWIGSEYDVTGFDGLRVLIVAESHYGSKRSERPTATPELVKALGQRQQHPSATARLRKHPHFARIVTTVNNASQASKFSTMQRSDFWEHVSYYNFLQEFMSAARVPPSDKAWADGREAFPEVLDALRPDLVIAFGKRLSRHLDKVSGNCAVAKVHHPSTGFSYNRWNPVINAALAQAAQIKRTAMRSQHKLPANLNFVEWYETSRKVLPSHGPHLPAAMLAEAHVTWARQMTELRRRRTSTGQR